MGDKTGIEWADATWNPLAGCSVVSFGCTNCYAMGEAARLERMGGKGGAEVCRADQGGPGRPLVDEKDRLSEKLWWAYGRERGNG